jgi:hypothetical protein
MYVGREGGYVRSQYEYVWPTYKLVCMHMIIEDGGSGLLKKHIYDPSRGNFNRQRHTQKRFN